VNRTGKTFQELVADAKAQVSEITVDTLKDWLTERKPLVVIDVREPMEFNHGSIPGALNIPRGILELDIDSTVPDPHQTIVIYCGGGSRSALSAQTLKIMGYDQVHSLTGGFRAWQTSITQG
jgi:rhodanese-related sulfurtransferase